MLPIALTVVGVTAWVVAAVATPFVVRAAAALHLVDRPDGERRIHATPVPRLGGVAVWIGIAIALTATFLFRPPIASDTHFMRGVLVGAAVLFVVGLVDDIRGVSPVTKIAAQIAGAAAAIWGGLALPAVGVTSSVFVPIPWGSTALLIAWIVLATNAFNLIDGLNGLAGGVGVIASVGVAAVALTLNHAPVAALAVATAAALLGFLRYNFPRAKVFLGDCGSMSVGYVIAVLSVRSASLPSGVVLFVIPIALFFLPLADTALAVIRRWLRNQPVSGADARHIHHRLIALGLSHRRTALVLWSVTAAVAAFGVVIELAPPVLALGLTIIGTFVVLTFAAFGTRMLAYYEFRIAGEVLRSGPAHFRRVIGDQIQAHDLSVLLRYADSVEDMSRILDANASRFGFQGMEIHSVDGETSRAWLRRELDTAWRLEYPLFAADDDGERTFVTHRFSIWCQIEDNARPYGAERVARILTPVLEYRLNEILRSVSPPRQHAGGRSPTPLRVPIRRYPKLR